MDKYSIGRAVTANTSFPLCKGLMISGAAAGTVVLYLNSGGLAGATMAATVAPLAGITILPLQCSSIGAITTSTVTALY